MLFLSIVESKIDIKLTTTVTDDPDNSTNTVYNFIRSKKGDPEVSFIVTAMQSSVIHH